MWFMLKISIKTYCINVVVNIKAYLFEQKSIFASFFSLLMKKMSIESGIHQLKESIFQWRTFLKSMLKSLLNVWWSSQ